MKIVSMAEGTKIDHTLKKNVLTLGGGLVALDLSQLERDFDVHIDICQNSFGMLTMGVSNSSQPAAVTQGSQRYVAQIDIPARQYEEIPDGIEEDEENGGGVIMKRVAMDFSTDNVTLSLWPWGGM